jgi:hypothetical protein
MNAVANALEVLAMCAAPLICIYLAFGFWTSTIDLLLFVYLPWYFILSMIAYGTAHYLFSCKWDLFPLLRMMVVIAYIAFTAVILLLITRVTMPLWPNY